VEPPGKLRIRSQSQEAHELRPAGQSATPNLLENVALDLAIRYADEPYVIFLQSADISNTLDKHDCLRLAEAEMFDAIQCIFKPSSSNPSAVHPETKLKISGFL
jgi:hypothetical protein